MTHEPATTRMAARAASGDFHCFHLHSQPRQTASSPAALYSDPALPELIRKGIPLKGGRKYPELLQIM